MTVMIKSSEANAHTKKRKREWEKTRRAKGKKRAPTARRVREGSDRRYRDKQREPMLRALTESRLRGGEGDRVGQEDVHVGGLYDGHQPLQL